MMTVFKDDRLEVAVDMYHLYYFEAAPNGRSHSFDMIGRMFEVSPTTVSTMIKEASVYIALQKALCKWREEQLETAIASRKIFKEEIMHYPIIIL